MIEVIDYGGGNLGSVLRCLKRLNADFKIANQHQPPTGKHPLLFPGVGAFGASMVNITQSGLADRLRSIIQDGTPYLGICVGLQVLFEASEEAPNIPGLSILPGRIVKFQNGKVPQIGWNRVQAQKENWENGYVYFVNSYYPQPEEPSMALYQADYYQPFTAAVQWKNITAFQFHPEKSDRFGQTLMQRWLTHVQN